MTRPIQRSGAAVGTAGATRASEEAAGQAPFAARLETGARVLGGPVGPSTPSLGQRVVNAALGDKPSALTSAMASLGSDPAASTLAQRLQQVRTFSLQNAIFDAGSAPVVERDNSV